MGLRATPFTVHDRVALAMSRGSQSEDPGLGVQIEQDGSGAGGRIVCIFSGLLAALH